MTSMVYSTTTLDDDKKLYELTTRMKLQASQVKSGYQSNNAVRIVDNAHDLADTVLEFLKVSGWSR